LVVLDFHESRFFVQKQGGGEEGALSGSHGHQIYETCQKTAPERGKFVKELEMMGKAPSHKKGFSKEEIFEE